MIEVGRIFSKKFDRHSEIMHLGSIRIKKTLIEFAKIKFYLWLCFKKLWILFFILPRKISCNFPSNSIESSINIILAQIEISARLAVSPLFPLPKNFDNYTIRFSSIKKTSRQKSNKIYFIWKLFPSCIIIMLLCHFYWRNSSFLTVNKLFAKIYQSLKKLSKISKKNCQNSSKFYEGF